VRKGDAITRANPFTGLAQNFPARRVQWVGEQHLNLAVGSRCPAELAKKARFDDAGIINDEYITAPQDGGKIREAGIGKRICLPVQQHHARLIARPERFSRD
jgi:hypothetical protein